MYPLAKSNELEQTSQRNIGSYDKNEMRRSYKVVTMPHNDAAQVKVVEIRPLLSKG